MKILKHGNALERRFVCPICKCEFIANYGDVYDITNTGSYIGCPEEECGGLVAWEDGEKYNDITKTNLKEKELDKLETIEKELMRIEILNCIRDCSRTQCDECPHVKSGDQASDCLSRLIAEDLYNKGYHLPEMEIKVYD